MAATHNIYGVGRFASDQYYYRLPVALGERVLPTGYYGWSGTMTGVRTDLVTDSKRRRAVARKATLITTEEVAVDTLRQGDKSYLR